MLIRNLRLQVVDFVYQWLEGGAGGFERPILCLGGAPIDLVTPCRVVGGGVVTQSGQFLVNLGKLLACLDGKLLAGQ